MTKTKKKKEKEPEDAVIEGCYICHKNNYQDKILLCERCNGEYHMFCLDPPLLSVPENDWYCGKKKRCILLGNKCKVSPLILPLCKIFGELLIYVSELFGVRPKF
jgi:PHD-finger